MNKLTTTLFLVAACHRAPKTDTVDPNKPTAIAVDEIPKEIPEYPAIIWTKSTTIIPSEVSAKVNKIYAHPGQQVKKGDLLLELDDKELQARARSAEAQIKSAQADANANYAEASNASRKARMQSTLYRGGAGTLEAVKDATTTAGAAGAKGQSAAERARSNQEDYKEILRQIEKCKVTADIDGELVFVNAAEGRILQKGANIARISDTSDLRVRFVVPMAAYRTIKRGQKVNVFLQNHDAPIPASVTELTAAAENHVDAAIIEADIDDTKVSKEEISASGQGFVRLVTAGGKS